MENDVSTTLIFFLYLMLAGPFVAVIFNITSILKPITAARLAGYSIGLGLLFGLSLLLNLFLLQKPIAYQLINLNTLNLVLCDLVLLVSFIVHRFSLRYMDGDRLYKRYFYLLPALTFTALLMVLADNLFLFWASWSSSNFFLVLLMIHKKEWEASKNAGKLAFYTLLSGSICLLIAIIILSIYYSVDSISTLKQLSNHGDLYLLSLSICLVLISALVQSGLFPFHRWLISSLNSPTPVSALMHAGLVNGGGILIVKFAPLITFNSTSLTILFLFGAVSALLGTIWKLMQHDIKKMLACSTMAQMGFMMMQCGLGLFAAAIAHLCWHGLFKAYLFLSSGSAITQKKSKTNNELQTSYNKPLRKLTDENVLQDASLLEWPRFIMIIVSLLGGIGAMLSFAFTANKTISFSEPSTFVLFFAMIAGSQLMLTWIRNYKTTLSILLGFILATFFGLMYGTSIHIIQCLIPNLSTLQTTQLSVIHWLVIFLFGTLWITFSFEIHKKLSQSRFGCWLYMNLFNASQPSIQTTTSLRSDYNY